ncbi:MAG: glutamate--tRNA ligase, partial [Candidatus Omnitrophica bacterium]|nr:glutamate--tRNA ligase [Candidatus Omnitrophota bacterium]
MIRVRFAPSPTGYLHIGSARTALFNWLFARHTEVGSAGHTEIGSAGHNNGKFIIRIEDTDKERSKKEFLDEILESLKWLGLNWDEGPYFQSERFEIYKKYADKLLKEDKAYLTTENKGVQTEKPAVKFKMPHERLTINDLVHGPIEINTEEAGDQVIIKSDGTPTYNFACAVDDADMGITHVIRGDDHISNTPKQIMLYRALGMKPPEFAHIPLILGTDRSRMSKRHGATSIMEYKQMGILPECLFNFLSLLGFSLGADREIATRDEIVKEFELSRINKTAAIFDMEKLKWMNGQYMKNKPTNALMDELVPILKGKGILKEGFDTEYFKKIIGLIKIRAKAMEDFVVESA